MATGNKRKLCSRISEFSKTDIVSALGSQLDNTLLVNLVDYLDKNFDVNISDIDDDDAFNQYSPHKLSTIPQSAPMSQFPDTLSRQKSDGRIAELESTIKRLQRQSSLLTTEFRRRESKGGIRAMPRISSLNNLGIALMPPKPILKPTVEMRLFHWEHIPDNAIKDTIWEKISKLEDEIVSKDIHGNSGNKGGIDASDDCIFLDELYENMKANKCSDKLISDLKLFLSVNEYDSDAVKYDLILADYGRNGNIYKENAQFMDKIVAFQKIKGQKVGLQKLEEYFCEKLQTKKKGSRWKKSNKKNEEKIILFDSNRSKGVIVGLDRLKMSGKEVKEALLEMDEDVLTLEFLTKLVKLVPTRQEIAKVQPYEGKAKLMWNLGECERFFLTFVGNMEKVKDRLEICLYKCRFEEKYNGYMSNVLALSYMQDTIRDSEYFQKVLAVMLACGNYINGGTKKGRKHGFALRELGTLWCAYKSLSDDRMSILGYVYQYLRSNYKDCLQWIEEFEDLPDIVRIDSVVLGKNIADMSNDLQKLDTMLAETDLQQTNDENDKFASVMDKFYNDSVEKVTDLQQSWADTRADIMDLACFFGQKVEVSKFKFEGFFALFNEFRTAFTEHKARVMIFEEEKDKLDRIEDKKKAKGKGKKNKGKTEKKGKKTTIWSRKKQLWD